MRVIAGEFRSRPLAAPKGDKTRPTTDRARESLFNVLTNLTKLEGLTVLDLFAGSGALGIEALSRGAAHATFVESDRLATDALNRNIAALGIEARTSVSRGDVYQYVTSARGSFGLIVADAPYEDVRARADLPKLLVDRLTADGLAIIEHRSGDRVEVSGAMRLLRELKAGEASFTILSRKQ